MINIGLKIEDEKEALRIYEVLEKLESKDLSYLEEYEKEVELALEKGKKLIER